MTTHREPREAGDRIAAVGPSVARRETSKTAGAMQDKKEGWRLFREWMIRGEHNIREIAGCLSASHDDFLLITDGALAPTPAQIAEIQRITTNAVPSTSWGIEEPAASACYVSNRIQQESRLLEAAESFRATPIRGNLAMAADLEVAADTGRITPYVEELLRMRRDGGF